MTERQKEVIEIKAAYAKAIKSLLAVGTLLLTKNTGRYLWAARHKTAVKGMCAVLRALKESVPYYWEDGE